MFGRLAALCNPAFFEFFKKIRDVLFMDLSLISIDLASVGRGVLLTHSKKSDDFWLFNSAYRAFSVLESAWKCSSVAFNFRNLRIINLELSL